MAALVRAGVTEETARAMEGWKATEVLDLLNVPSHLIVRRSEGRRFSTC